MFFPFRRTVPVYLPDSIRFQGIKSQATSGTSWPLRSRSGGGLRPGRLYMGTGKSSSFSLDLAHGIMYEIRLIN